MLLVLVKVKRLLDLVSKTLAWSLAVSAMLLLVDISGATSLYSRQSCVVYGMMYDVRRCETRLARCAG